MSYPSPGSAKAGISSSGKGGSGAGEDSGTSLCPSASSASAASTVAVSCGYTSAPSNSSACIYPTRSRLLPNGISAHWSLAIPKYRGAATAKFDCSSLARTAGEMTLPRKGASGWGGTPTPNY